MSKNFRAHLIRCFAGHTTIGHLVFFALFPMIIALILGWFGLGVFKPWSSRLAAVSFWIGITTLLWAVSYALFCALKRVFSVTEIGIGLTVIGCVSAIGGTFFFRPLASLYGHIYGIIMGYDRSLVITPLPYSLESLIKWHLDYVPFIFLWTFGIILLELYNKNGAAVSQLIRKSQLGTDRFLSLLTKIDYKSLIALSAEGHYIRVYTVDREIRIHYRFSAALNILANRNGVRIHRSHWVNTLHIKHLESNINRAFLELSNGLKLPVSLPYRDYVAGAVGAARQNIITQ